MGNKKLIVILAVAVIVIAAVAFVLVTFVFGGEKPIVYTQYSPGEYFVTNVKDSNRLFKTSIVLVLDTDKLQEQLSENNALIRDTIIFIQRGFTADEISSENVHEQMREEIIKALNEVFGIENFVGVLFNDFVMQ